jgi:hypothetical protein
VVLPGGKLVVVIVQGQSRISCKHTPFGCGDKPGYSLVKVRVVGVVTVKVMFL